MPVTTYSVPNRTNIHLTWLLLVWSQIWIGTGLGVGTGSVWVCCCCWTGLFVVCVCVVVWPLPNLVPLFIVAYFLLFNLPKLVLNAKYKRRRQGANVSCVLYAKCKCRWKLPTPYPNTPTPWHPSSLFNNVIKECCLKEIEIDMDNHNGSAWYFLIESLDLQAKFLAIFQLLSISNQSHWLGTGTGNSSVPELSTKLVRFSLQ